MRITLFSSSSFSKAMSALSNLFFEIDHSNNSNQDSHTYKYGPFICEITNNFDRNTIADIALDLGEKNAKRISDYDLETQLTFYELAYPEDFPKDKTEVEYLSPNLESNIKNIIKTLNCHVAYIDGQSSNELRKTYMDKFNDYIKNKKE